MLRSSASPKGKKELPSSSSLPPSSSSLSLQIDVASDGMDVLSCDPTCAIKLLLPNLIVGVIIGEKGKTIRVIKEQSQASIKISAANMFYPGSADRIVLIYGKESNVLEAVKLIISIVTLSRRIDGQGASLSQRSAVIWDPATIDVDTVNDFSYIVLRTSVPTVAGGLLLGRNGQTIQAISEASGTRLHISSKEESLVWSERILTIAGPASGCAICMQLVLNKLGELNPRFIAKFSSQDGNNSIHSGGGSPCSSSSSSSSPCSSIPASSSPSSVVGGDGGRDRDFDGMQVEGAFDEMDALEKTSDVSAGTVQEDERAPSTGTNSSSNTTHDTALTSSSSSNSRIPSVVGNDHPVSNSQQFDGNGSPKRTKTPSLSYYLGTASTPILLAKPLVLYTIPYPPVMVQTGSLDVQLDSVADITDHIYATTTIVMIIPDEHIGTVFGKNGSSLREIKHTSQAEICVSNRGEFEQGTMNRRVTITGYPANARAAMLLIQEKIQALSEPYNPSTYHQVPQQHGIMPTVGALSFYVPSFSAADGPGQGQGGIGYGGGGGRRSGGRNARRGGTPTPVSSRYGEGLSSPQQSRSGSLGESTEGEEEGEKLEGEGISEFGKQQEEEKKTEEERRFAPPSSADTSLSSLSLEVAMQAEASSQVQPQPQPQPQPQS